MRRLREIAHNRNLAHLQSCRSRAFRSDASEVDGNAQRSKDRLLDRGYDHRGHRLWPDAGLAPGVALEVVNKTMLATLVALIAPRLPKPGMTHTRTGVLPMTSTRPRG